MHHLQNSSKCLALLCSSYWGIGKVLKQVILKIYSWFYAPGPYIVPGTEPGWLHTKAIAVVPVLLLSPPNDWQLKWRNIQGLIYDFNFITWFLTAVFAESCYAQDIFLEGKQSVNRKLSESFLFQFPTPTEITTHSNQLSAMNTYFSCRGLRFDVWYHIRPLPFPSILGWSPKQNKTKKGDNSIKSFCFCFF